MYTDPLSEYEKKSEHGHKKPIVYIFLRGIKFLLVYLLLSGSIFSVFLGILNFGAYSARILDWIDPENLIRLQDDLTSAIARSSIEVHAGTAESQSHINNTKNSITEKMATISPALVYSRSYPPENLLQNVGHQQVPVRFDLAPYENRIIIPKIGKNIPLVDVDHGVGVKYTDMHEIFMEELKKGVVRYPGTAQPGQVGNAFIFGHSSNYPWIKSEYNDIFALLDNLETGDEIIVYYNQKKYVYRVTDRAIVKPGDVKALESRDPHKKELSLMTCWPIGTTLERIIIFAELQENI